MLNFIQISTTTETKEEAEKISQEILEKQFAACVQIIGPIKSSYWWKDKIEQAEEWLCLIKTHEKYFDEIEKLISSIHSYETPEIIATPIITGSKKYIEWISGLMDSQDVRQIPGTPSSSSV